MPGLDARTLPTNYSLRGKLEALKVVLDSMMADIEDIVYNEAIYDLSPLRQSIQVPGKVPPPPRGWSCMPVTAWPLDEIQSLAPFEIRLAIEDLKNRVEFIERFVKG